MIDETTYLNELRAIHARNWPSDVPSEVRYPLGEIPLSDHLRHWGESRPDAPAIIYYGHVTTYGELDALSEAFANALCEAGIGKGDRVAVFLPNCPQFHIVFFGILKLGAVHVPISPLSKAFELRYHLEDSGATALVTLDALMPVVRAVRDDSALNAVFCTSLSEMLPETPTISVPPAVSAPAVTCADAIDLMPALKNTRLDRVTGGDLDSVAALNYTGGTTGMPKGCIHTQRDMVFTGAANWSVSMRAKKDIVWLNFFPEFWIAGENAALIFPMITGSPMILMTRWDPLGFLEAVQAHRATNVAMLVDAAVELMDHPRFGAFDLSSLQSVSVVSFVKKLNMDYRQRWFDLTGTIISEASWGMTETHTSNTFTTGMQDDDYDLHAQPVFVGLPVPGNEFKICDFDTGALLPLGSEGEIVVRMPSLFKGYWNKHEETEVALRDGWLHSGDIGLIDEDGYLHYLGRRKEMLKVKGMSVFPAELESLLGRQPAVAASAVIGRPDAHKGQVPVAFVVLKPEQANKVSAEGLSDWLSAQLSAYKVPEVKLVASLPMTATGKVKKDELEKLLEVPEAQGSL